LFLEDAFGSGVIPKQLREAGFAVECFGDHFSDPDRKKEQAVKDPRIIQLCHEKKWVLITTDKNILYTHVQTIRKTEVLIIATESNRIELDIWVQALIKAKPKIERLVKRSERPYFACIGRTGNLNRKQVGTTTRRHRPKEGQEK
jgi:Txe/YoeB family toxin of Txe-Axe toxin-antitoxin module